MAVKLVLKQYSPEEVEALKKSPNALGVRENRLLLTTEFRQQAYEAWIRRPEWSTARRMLEVNGFDIQRLGLNFIKSVESVFKWGGRPKFPKAPPETQANWTKIIYMPTMIAEELVESGKSVQDVNRLILHPDFEAELHRNYLQQSMEDGLLSARIPPADMDYHKTYWLQERFEHPFGQDTNRNTIRGRTAHYTAAMVEQYRKHPYVQAAAREKIELNKAFFEVAVLIAALVLDDILRVFDINSEIFLVTERHHMSQVLAAWAIPADGEIINISPTRKIPRNRTRVLDSIVEKGFLQIGDIVSSLNVLQKKSLCLWLRDLPSDPGRKYSARKILSSMKISRVSYYAIPKNGTYGQSVVQGNAQDKRDAELIRTAMEYKGFAKDSRQTYMMMPALTGKRMGLKKICRIMRTYNLISSTRKAASSKRMGGAALKKGMRSNLLQRRFRLYRSNEVWLTDVTHLFYGDGCKVYDSALFDPVANKSVALLVSEYDDLELALATLRQPDLHPCISGELYHSDQETVYLSGAFQQEVSKRDCTQSMSRRGNCQDNVLQESFSGHSKDECPHSECKDIEELRELVARYAEYYNYERRMWDRGRMTPVEYEQYPLAMNEVEFLSYIAKEEKRYQRIKKKLPDKLSNGQKI